MIISPLLSDEEKNIMLTEHDFLYWLSKDHCSVFGDNDPRPRHDIYQKIFGYAGRSFSRHVYPLIKVSFTLFNNYIDDVNVPLLKGVTPKEELVEYQDLINDVKVNGVVVPLIVTIDYFGVYEILEGHHRAGAALVAGVDCVPAFVLFEYREGKRYKNQLKFFDDL